MQKNLKLRQVCLFLIVFSFLPKLFMMPSILARYADEDLWISGALNILLEFITLFFIVLVYRKENSNIFELLEEKFGKTISKVILCLFFIYFMIKSVIPLNEQKDYVDLTLYTLRPTLIYFLPFFILAFYFCTKKLRILGRVSDGIFATSLIGIIILFALSISNADFTSFLPIGAKGIRNIATASYSTLNWFGESAYCLFFIGEFYYKKKDGIKILFSYLLGSLITIAFLIVFYSVFTSISFRQRFALTEISKYATVINNIGRFDYLGILLLLFSNLFSLSLPLYFACIILNRIFKIKKAWISPIIVVGVQFVIMTVFYQFYNAFEKIIISYGGILFFIVGNLLPIIISIITIIGGNYERKAY